jgi:hypothetical protein
MDLAHVLWIGGATGSGKTSIARALAYRWDLQLYNLDHRTYDHVERLGGREAGWDLPAEKLAERFVAHARERWPLVLEDLAALPSSPAAIAEGPHLLPELVPPDARAVFLVPTEERIRETRAERASLPVVAARDVMLAARIRDTAGDRTVIDVDRPLAEMIEIVAGALVLDGLPRALDRPAIRRHENDALARQLTLWPGYGGWPVPFACECDAPGCSEMIELTLADYVSGGAGRSPSRAPRS